MGGAVVLGGGLAGGLKSWNRHEGGQRSSVFIAKAPDYSANLTDLILQGLKESGVTKQIVRGKRILLKPNMVETTLGKSHINTDPAVVVGAAEAFRILGATKIIVAEGQGLHRDGRLVLDASGMENALRPLGVSFVDLNYDEVVTVENKGKWTSLDSIHLPKTLLHVDWIVSLPKLKTHHWAGVTCAMKNLYGVLPGIVYGWPKNVLHNVGIHKSIVDIAATVKPSFSIVDGIVGMEGDGPIMGTPKSCGCLIMGRNPVAVDATATRVMGLNPYGVGYLKLASGHLGPIHEWNIQQRGETIENVKTNFNILDLPHLSNLIVS